MSPFHVSLLFEYQPFLAEGKKKKLEISNKTNHN